MKYGNKTLRRRGKGDTWEAAYYYRDPLTGKRKVIYRRFKAKTKKTAESLRDEIRYQLELDGKLDQSAATVKELMTKFVDYKDASGTIEEATVIGYRYNTNFVVRWLGDVKIAELTADDVNQFMADALAKGYAAASVVKPFRLLKEALNYAVINDLVQKNVCDYCKPPRRSKPKVEALSDEEARRMLDLAFTAGHEHLAVAIVLAITTGMRRGEICGLKWSDVDFKGGTLTVNHALTLGKSGTGYYLKAPKTGVVRTIPLTHRTLNLLKEIRSEQECSYKVIGVKAPDSYVCGDCDIDCKPYNPAKLGKDFKAFCKMNGFNVSLHGLRHTFATLMIASGVDVRTVSSYLGHASPSMTLDIYAEVDPQAKRAAVGKIESVFNAGMLNDAAEMIAEKNEISTPVCNVRDNSLLAQEPVQEPNMAMQLLLSDGYDKMDDSDKLMLMGLIRKYS